MVTNSSSMANTDFLIRRLRPPLDRRYLNRGYCFESAAFAKAMPVYAELRKVHRQENDEMVQMLNAIRCGDLGAGTMPQPTPRPPGATPLPVARRIATASPPPAHRSLSAF